MEYIGEIISGGSRCYRLAAAYDTRPKNRRRNAAAIRAKESKLAMKMQDAKPIAFVGDLYRRGAWRNKRRNEDRVRDKAKTAQEEYEDFVHELL